MRRALNSPIVRRAVSSARLWREVPVLAPIDEGVLEGFIDLLFEEEDGLVVVDYKTDALESQEQIDRSMERYRLQGGAYALALQKTTGRSVKKVVFLFPQPQQEVFVEDLAAAMTEAEKAAIAHLSGE